MSELGAGAGTGYPAAIDTKQTYVNGPNPVPDSNSRVDQEFMNDAYAAIVAIETELGTNPSAGDATLTARLAGTEFEKTANKGAANGYASLDAGSQVPAAQIPTHGASKHDGTVEATANKNAASGYAGLDAGPDLRPGTYGGFRHAVGNWEQQNVAANQSAIVLKLNADNTEIVLPYAGSVLAISVAATEARTAGTLTVEASINGTLIGLSAVLDGTNPQFKATTQAKDTDAFAAGDRIGVKITTDAGWLPTTSDIIVTIWLEM